MKSIRSAWSRASLQLKIFGYSVALVATLVGSVLAFSYQRASRLARESLEQALSDTRDLYENLEADRLAKLELVNRLVAESPVFKAAVAETDSATVLDTARMMVEQIGSDFMIVTDRDGKVLARTDQPGQAGEDLSATPLIALALQGESASGVWREGEKLYHAVAVPLIIGADLPGTVASAYRVGDGLANHIKRFTRCEVAFFAGSGGEMRVAGSTLAGNAAAFRDWLSEQRMAGQAADLQPNLGGETYQAVLVPLRSAGGEGVGFFAALRSRDRELASFRAFQRSALSIGLLMLGVAVGASLIVSRGITRPIKKLVTVTDRVREGDYGSDVEAETEDEIGALARSFQALLGELREKALMEKYISKSAAEMIQRTESAAMASARRPVTVLFSDLRAFAALEGKGDTQPVISSLNRALSREAELVERYGGQVDKFIGDRMMAVFEGPEMVWSAVRCANAIQQYLAEESASQPISFLPSIGVSAGEAVFGTVGSADRLDYTLLGTAVHLAGRLCEEALPGEILLSEEAFQKVKDRAAAEPVGPLKVHGLENPQPVYLISSGTIRLRTRDSRSIEALEGSRPSPAGARTGMTQPTVAAPVSLATIKPGYLLGGRYEILRLLGTGGMGMVFQAHDRELDEPVALKVLRPEILSMDPTIMDRFKQEIRLARRITHRNVLRTYDFGELEGVKFISMEYLQGVTLKQLIKKNGALPLKVGLRVARQTCAALAAAHEQGVVHRDVKPQNIILTPTSELKIMDFGIARPVDMRGVTATGLVVGTPDYMSPEQAQGRQDLDQRSDIYSGGVVFYEMFTGRLPFRGDSALAIAMKHVQEPPAPPRKVNPNIPDLLEAILLRSLKKNPAERYQKITEVHADLQKVVS